jgi:molybdate transport system ATP-binding protein
MTTGLSADFEKLFSAGPLIRAKLHVPTNGFSMTVLFGPSGSGKTTILRCLAGLERPNRGHIRFEEQTWFDAGQGVFLSPQKRAIGFLSQDYALFPHLPVARNIAYGLRGIGAAEQQQRIQKTLDLFGLTGLEGRLPRQLSGGEQQRVALARALVRRPRLLLLDEPLSALDTPSREHLRRELRQLLAELAVPAVLVTHDRLEALALGDTVSVLDKGRICQSGSVQEVFAHPATLAVARITGVDTVQSAQILAVADGLATVAVGATQLLALARGMSVGDGYISIRAEDVILAKGTGHPSSARNHLTGPIRTMIREGPMVRITLDCGFPLAALITNQACSDLSLHEGDQVTALVKATSIQLVPRDGMG